MTITSIDTFRRRKLKRTSLGRVVLRVATMDAAWLPLHGFYWGDPKASEAYPHLWDE